MCFSTRTVPKFAIDMAAIHKCGHQLLKSLPLSHELASFDYYLLPKIKNRNFCTNDDAIKAVDTFLKGQDAIFYRKCINILQNVGQNVQTWIVTMLENK